MKFKTKTLVIAFGLFLARPCYEICKHIYQTGVNDGKANAHKAMAVKK